MDYNQELNEAVASYVTKLFERFQTADLLYHNLHHTLAVIERVNEIAFNYSLDNRERFIINTAAWFHDSGHLFGPASGHEERSNLIMRGHLKKIKVEEDIIQLTEQSVFATRFPYEPASALDQILCDADSYHFGTDDFLITDDLVKEEFRLRNNYLPVNWDIKTLAMLEEHHFFTPYCRSLLRDGKQKNIDFVRSKIGDGG
jgi:predicted metal-dependent HD superfamily phosphohydrolase